MSCAGFLATWVASRAKVQPWFVAGLFFLQIGLNIAYASQAALPADLAVESEEGKNGFISGLIGAHSFCGSLVGICSIVAARDMPVQDEYIFYVSALMVTGFIICMSVTEEPMDKKEMQPLTWRDIGASFGIDLESDLDFFWVCVGRLCYYVSTSITVFLYYFLRDIVGIATEWERRKILCCLSIVTLLIGCIVAVPSGRVSDHVKVGRKRVIYSSAVMMILCMAVYITCCWEPRWWLLAAACLIYGAGSGAYLSVDYALALDVLPKRKTSAEALGLWGVAGFFGSMTGPMVGGALLAANSVTESKVEGYTPLGYTLLMAFGIIATVFECVFTSLIKGTK